MDKRKVRNTRSKQCPVGRLSNEELSTHADSNENLVVQESSSEIGSDDSFSPPKNSSPVLGTSQILRKSNLLQNQRYNSRSELNRQHQSEAKKIQKSKIPMNPDSVVEAQKVTSTIESEHSIPALSQRESLYEDLNTSTSSDSEASDNTSNSGSELTDSTIADADSEDQNASDSESLTETPILSSATSSKTSHQEEESSDESLVNDSFVNVKLGRSWSDCHWQNKVNPVSLNIRRNVVSQNIRQKIIQNNAPPPPREPNRWDRNVELRKQLAELQAEKELRDLRARLDKPDKPSRWNNCKDSWKRLVRPEEPPWKIVADGRKVVVTFGFRRSNKVKDSKPSPKKVYKPSFKSKNHANLYPDEFGNPPRQRIPFTCKHIRIYFIIKWQGFKDFFSNNDWED